MGVVVNTGLHPKSRDANLRVMPSLDDLTKSALGVDADTAITLAARNDADSYALSVVQHGYAATAAAAAAERANAPTTTDDDLFTE